MMRWMLALLAVPLSALAQGGPPHGPPHGPGGMMREMSPEDQKAIHDYKLTTGNVDKMMAAHLKFRDMAEKDPSMREGNPFQAKTIDDSVKKIESAPPKAQAILKETGMKPREFVVGTMTMMTSAMWSSMQKMNPQAPVPAYVNPDNLAFIDAHPEIMEKFKNMGPRHGPPGGGHEHE
jgi:hypothetical protein